MKENSFLFLLPIVKMYDDDNNPSPCHPHNDDGDNRKERIACPTNTAIYLKGSNHSTLFKVDS